MTIPTSLPGWPTPAKDTPLGIGDTHSMEPGTAARYNSGKPDYSLVPLRIVASCYLIPAPTAVASALDVLGGFQGRETNDLSPIFDLLGLGGWRECAEVFSYGQKKYTAWNWTKGFPWSSVIASCARHLIAMCKGEALDPESGLPHRGHVFCNIVMLETFATTYLEGDDRPATGALA